MKKNKLTQEEEALRAKIEEIEFDYQVSDWKSLEQKLPTNQTLQLAKWLAASTAVILLSTAVYFLSKDSSVPAAKGEKLKKELSTAKVDQSIDGKKNIEIGSEKVKSEAETKLNAKEEKSIKQTPTQTKTSKKENKLTNSSTESEKSNSYEQAADEHAQTEKENKEPIEESVDLKALKESVYFKIIGKACVGESIKLIAEANAVPRSNLIWKYGSNKMNGREIDLKLHSEKPTLISLFYQNENGELSKLKDTLISPNTPPKSDFFFTEHDGIFNDFQVTFTVEELQPSETYKWLLNDKIIGSKSEDVYDFNQAGNYKVTLFVSGKDGCEANLTKTVHVKDDHSLFINAFTPNGDGYLDTFMPQGFEDFDGNFSFKVYNLQNNLLYETQSPVEGWNGRIKNSGPMQDLGLYVWEIKVSDNKGNYRAFKDKVKIIK